MPSVLLIPTYSTAPNTDAKPSFVLQEGEVNRGQGVPRIYKIYTVKEQAAPILPATPFFSDHCLSFIR